MSTSPTLSNDTLRAEENRDLKKIMTKFAIGGFVTSFVSALMVCILFI